jgi:hypothetical protein
MLAPLSFLVQSESLCFHLSLSILSRAYWRASRTGLTVRHRARLLWKLLGTDWRGPPATTALAPRAPRLSSDRLATPSVSERQHFTRTSGLEIWEVNQN